MDSKKKAFAVHVRFGNAEHSVPSGITADIDIETSLIEKAIVVHRNEILKNQNDWYVYVEKDGYASRQIVQPGQRQGMYYQLEAGLQPGDKLITRGVGMVRDQSPVFVVKEDSAVLVIKD
jgi:multidrug efflux pump subunit AcrA (membrane-fusion protein)